MLKRLSLLLLLRDTAARFPDAQFLISSHSPILLGYPDAQILSFDGGRIHEISYEECQPMLIMKRFVNDRSHFLGELFSEDATLFDL